MLVACSTEVYVHKTCFGENCKDTIPLRGHTTFVLLTPSLTMTIIDKVTIFCKLQ